MPFALKKRFTQLALLSLAALFFVPVASAESKPVDSSNESTGEANK